MSKRLTFIQRKQLFRWLEMSKTRLESEQLTVEAAAAAATVALGFTVIRGNIQSLFRLSPELKWKRPRKPYTRRTAIPRTSDTGVILELLSEITTRVSRIESDLEALRA